MRFEVAWDLLAGIFAADADRDARSAYKWSSVESAAIEIPCHDAHAVKLWVTLGRVLHLLHQRRQRLALLSGTR